MGTEREIIDGEGQIYGNQSSHQYSCGCGLQLWKQDFPRLPRSAPSQWLVLGDGCWQPRPHADPSEGDDTNRAQQAAAPGNRPRLRAGCRPAPYFAFNHHRTSQETLSTSETSFPPIRGPWGSPWFHHRTGNHQSHWGLTGLPAVPGGCGHHEAHPTSLPCCRVWPCSLR